MERKTYHKMPLDMAMEEPGAGVVRDVPRAKV